MLSTNVLRRGEVGDMEISIKCAEFQDLKAVLDPLERLGLPGDGVTEHISEFLVAKDPQSGLRLTSAMLEDAPNRGITEVVLLTTTAETFFEKKFGFERTSWAQYEQMLHSSVEWNLPRCHTPAVMRLRLS